MSNRSTRNQLPSSITLPSFWRRRAMALFVAGVCVIGVVCSRTELQQNVASSVRPTTGDDHARYHDRSFKVARVVDGDTLDIEAPDRGKSVTRIRLWGVDTPEVTRGSREGGHFGAEASEFAKNLLEGKTVHVVLSPRRTRGKYGRLLAYVFLERGGVMFNELLLENGFAYADRRFPHHYKKQFEAIEKRTRRDGVGLWATVTRDQMPKWRQRFEPAPTETSQSERRP